MLTVIHLTVSFFINSVCPLCQSELSCSGSDTTNCWCADFPPFISTEKGKQCLCKPCLVKAFSASVKSALLADGLDAMLLLASQDSNSTIENVDFVVEKGQYVFTQWAHLKRGSCCGNGCKNCPY